MRNCVKGHTEVKENIESMVLKLLGSEPVFFFNIGVTAAVLKGEGTA